MVASPTSRLTKTAGGPGPAPRQPESQQPGFSLYPKKVNIVQSKGRESPWLPRGAPCVSCSPVPSPCGRRFPGNGGLARSAPELIPVSGQELPIPLPTDRRCTWSKEPLHPQRSTLSAAPCHHPPAARLAPGITRRQTNSKCDGGRAALARAAPQLPAARGTGRGVHRRGVTLGANTPLPTTVLSLLQDKGAGGSSTPRCTHRPLGPFPPASAAPGLYNQQSGPWGRVEGVGGVRAGQCLRGRGWRRGDSPSCGWSAGRPCSSPAAAS